MAILKLFVPGRAASLVLAATLSLAILPVNANAAVCKENGLSNANNMIFKSSAARQVEGSNSEEALARLVEAKKLYAGAEQEANVALCRSLISQSLGAFFKAVKLAKPEEASEVKHNVDFENKEKSAAALLDAMEYIMAESKDKKEFKLLKAEVDALFDKAHTMKDKGHVVEGMHVMEEAIVLLKNEVQAKREGVTLVRSLDFANAEEEYHYEIDRNDTHTMLVTVLLKEKRDASDRVNDKVNAYMAKAEVLRAQAEAAATKKDFKMGIKLLEDSTKEIVRAIRSAGVYIPG